VNEPLSDVVVYGISRVLSAGLSLVLFALVSRACSPEDAKAIYFFTFTYGFIVQALRTTANLLASVEGQGRRGPKLARVSSTASRLLPLNLVVAAVSLVLLRVQQVPWWGAALAALLVPLAAVDTDLIRAALGRGPRFALIFLAGGLLSVAVLSIPGEVSVTRGCVAMAVQWVPSSLVAAKALWRLRRGGEARARVAFRRDHLLATMGASLYDGVVLNTPFLVGGVGVVSGLELSVTMRLFVSSLVLVPLVLHWSNSGVLGRLAAKCRWSEPRLYFVAVLVPGVLGTAALALGLTFLSGRTVTVVELGLSVVLLAAYAVFARGVRYRAATSVGALGATMVMGYATVLAVFMASRSRDWAVPAIVAAQATALVSAGLMASRVTRAAVAAPTGEAS
jgi:hypothetical protein